VHPSPVHAHLHTHSSCVQFLSTLTHTQVKKVILGFVLCKFCVQKNINLVLHIICVFSASLDRNVFTIVVVLLLGFIE
jgi:hypothetical protein